MYQVDIFCRFFVYVCLYIHLFIPYLSYSLLSLIGLWNGIWSDMFIETTFMRYGHGPSGIIGITLKPETLKTWALGLHICCRLEQDIADIVENGQQIASQQTHKEEMKARIVSDCADRENIRKRSWSSALILLIPHPIHQMLSTS